MGVQFSLEITSKIIYKEFVWTGKPNGKKFMKVYDFCPGFYSLI